MAELRSLKPVPDKTESARERAFRLHQQSERATAEVVEQALGVMREALAFAKEASTLPNAHRGVADELRRMCDDADRRMATIEQIQMRSRA